MEETALSGMKAIIDYCGSIGLRRTESSILQLKIYYGFPMNKLLGIWESDKVLIAEWRKKNAAGEINFTPGTTVKTKKRSNHTRRG